MNKILKLALVLLAVSVVVAGVLGVINELTYPVIDAQKQAKTAEAFSAVLKADRFDEIEFNNPDFPTVLTVHKAEGVGYVVTSKFSGAQGNITLAVGVDNDYKCTGISVIEHAETSGLGANAASTDALTGATITSRAITEAVATSIRAVKSLG